MATNEPTDAIGRPLRQPTTAPDGWAAWRAWGEDIQRQLRTKAASETVDSILNTLERMAEALQAERREREQLGTELQNLRIELGVKNTMVDLAERLDRLEADNAKAEARGAPAAGNVVAMAR